MNLLTAKDVCASSLYSFFYDTDLIRKAPKRYRKHGKGKVLAFVKDEGSTRTRISFEVAMKKLGGEFVLLELDKSSSVVKGETIEDTIRTVSEYADVIVMRHSEKGMVAKCAKVSSVPVINAGDGDGEHPTQALLDVYTIWRECGTIDGINIMVVGDLKCSRTVHSLLQILSNFKDNTVHLVSSEDMKLPQSYKPSGLNYVIHDDLDDALKKIDAETLDVLYMTRYQSERRWINGELRLGDNYTKGFTLNPELLGKNCKVLHPLPRNLEIPTSFDSDERAAYFRQAKNGMYVRMALLSNLFEDDEFF